MQIIWTEFAEKNVAENLDYFEREWGKSSAIDFLDRIDASLLAIQKNPETYLIIGFGDRIHKFIVNSHVSLYYQISEDAIFLLTFWNNSWNPEMLHEFLKP
jgi:plasmid stabilization system protein ParE